MVLAEQAGAPPCCASARPGGLLATGWELLRVGDRAPGPGAGTGLAAERARYDHRSPTGSTPELHQPPGHRAHPIEEVDRLLGLGRDDGLDLGQHHERHARLSR